jgi:hypothetical protein
VERQRSTAWSARSPAARVAGEPAFRGEHPYRLVPPVRSPGVTFLALLFVLMVLVAALDALTQTLRRRP